MSYTYTTTTGQQGTNTYRIIADERGSVRLVVDSATGEVKQRLDYDAWGSVTLDTNPAYQPFGFAGGLYENDTGLVHFGARDYDARFGRWVSKDPILFRGRQTNSYVYVGNDPVNRVDRRGLMDIFVGVDLDFVGITGLETGFGLVLDTDHPLESGFYTNGEPGFGQM
jgi:RHS repeat-associated protein